MLKGLDNYWWIDKSAFSADKNNIFVVLISKYQNTSLKNKIMGRTMVFCYQNCFDLLWEKRYVFTYFFLVIIIANFLKFSLTRIQSTKKVVWAIRDIWKFWMIPNWSLMIKGVTSAPLGPIWYHSKPSDVPNSPNQFLGWGFFAASYSKTALGNCKFGKN